ncbi:MAG: AAA family ATPase [bacterium]|nr:AAA family ATPase [bacterium]
MQIKQLKVAGFRGFNEERVVDFDERLTVISAANSYGKTSISEAFEFLLYGTTSKVDKADFKDEYKDSYRNRHYPTNQAAYIEANFSVPGQNNILLRIELDQDGTVRRLVDGVGIKEWPFHQESLISARPFVLQHALKYLLLVPPSERFQGFAQLLGMNEVDDAFRAILSLCTKPTVNLPEDSQRLLNNLASLETKMVAVPELKTASADFKKGSAGVDAAYEVISSWSEKFLGIGKIGDHFKLLTAARIAAAGKVYAGSVVIGVLTSEEESRLISAQRTLSATVDIKFLEDYARLCVQGVAAKLQKEAQLLELGTQLLNEEPSTCPLCLQSVNDDLGRAIHSRHTTVSAEVKKDGDREQVCSRVNHALEEIKGALKQHTELTQKPLVGLVSSADPENETKITELLGGSETASVVIIRTSATTANSLCARLFEEVNKAETALVKCQTSLQSGTPNLSDAETLASALQSYLTVADDIAIKIKELEPVLTGPANLLRQAVDMLAGTTEVSLAVELFEKRAVVKKALHLRDGLDSLRDLKKYSEQTLAEVMDNAMNTDLTASVMKWYSMIKTTGDPDVHFSGFAMERTKDGDFKSRRLSVKAESYGVELASAVSSLSESKLNALGLCVSIASALRRAGPWVFLIIDDPIQSWDDEHETQFINVIRSLIEIEGRQVIILTHKGTWAKQVCDGCRSLNGVRYEITGYAQSGPNVRALEWSSLDDRLREAESIVSAVTATSVRLQQAEEEIRLAAYQLASAVAMDKLGRQTSPHNMNKKDVRSILLEAGVATDEVDRLYAVFVNANDSHHTPKTYQPNVQRIRQAISTLREIRKLTKTS